MALTYRDAGVDIDEGDRLVDLIKPLARPTLRPEVLAGIGGFGGLFALDVKKYREPVLFSGTDGVGTKLKIAFAANRHGTIGQDLVAMCVNDVAVVGAEPLFFLDYFATGKLSAEQGAEVVKGIAEGCRLPGNVPRNLPDGTRAVVDERRWPRPAIFDVVEREGQVPHDEMVRTFNMGLGLVAVVAPADEAAVHEVLGARGLAAWTVGAIEKGAGEATCEVVR